MGRLSEGALAFATVRAMSNLQAWILIVEVGILALAALKSLL